VRPFFITDPKCDKSLAGLFGEGVRTSAVWERVRIRYTVVLLWTNYG
jgi:hypothetical protein